MKVEQIQAWLREQEASLDKRGIEEFQIRITAHRIMACGYIDKAYWARFGKTIEEAAASLRELVPPSDERAKKLREEARRLLREAVEIEVANGGAR